MAVNDTVQLSVVGSLGGTQHIHTLHFRFQELTSSDQGLIDAWRNTCRLDYRNLFLNSQAAVLRLVARQVCGTVPLRAPVETTEAAPNVLGTRAEASELLPPWLASTITWRTALAGKSYRGRSFLGGMAEVDQNQGAVVAGHIARVQAYINMMLASFGTNGTQTGYKFVVHSHKLASGPSVPCQNSSTLVISGTPGTQVASMRSRRAGSGS
jgi:hypothetical protein